MNKKLSETLDMPMKTILAVRAAFDYCETEDDIKSVIKKIPPKFGEFRLLMMAPNEGCFTIQNIFEKDGETKSQIIAHDFYHVQEDQ